MLPADSVSFCGRPSSHIFGVGWVCVGGWVVEGCSGGWRKILGRVLSYVSVFSAVLAGFSFLHLPSASVGIRGVPLPHIAQFRQHDI